MSAQLRRMALTALGWFVAWVAMVAGLYAIMPSSAHAMTVADVPAVPANAVEVCDHHGQTVCPIVASAAPMNVDTQNTIAGAPAMSGRIVRFEPINGEMGAWIVLARTGGQLWFPLRDLTLLGAR